MWDESKRREEEEEEADKRNKDWWRKMKEGEVAASREVLMISWAGGGVDNSKQFNWKCWMLRVRGWLNALAVIRLSQSSTLLPTIAAVIFLYICAKTGGMFRKTWNIQKKVINVIRPLNEELKSSGPMRFSSQSEGKEKSIPGFISGRLH